MRGYKQLPALFAQMRGEAGGNSNVEVSTMTASQPTDKENHLPMLQPYRLPVPVAIGSEKRRSAPRNSRPQLQIWRKGFGPRLWTWPDKTVSDIKQFQSFSIIRDHDRMAKPTEYGFHRLAVCTIDADSAGLCYGKGEFKHNVYRSHQQVGDKSKWWAGGLVDRLASGVPRRGGMK